MKSKYFFILSFAIFILLMIGFVSASGALTSNPTYKGIMNGSIDVSTLSDASFFSMVNENSSLALNSPIIYSEVTRRAENNVSLMNSNPGVRSQWLNKFGIVDKSSGLKNVTKLNAGFLIETNGKNPVVFDPSMQKGATINKDGSLTMQNGAVVNSGKINFIKNSDGTSFFSLENGSINLTKSKNFIGKIGPFSSASFGGKIYHSGRGPYSLNLSGNVESFSGIVTESKDGKILSSFSGNVVIKPNGEKILGKNTNYYKYFNGDPSNLYKTDAQTTFSSSRTSSSGNYIFDNGTSLEISSSNANIEISSKGNYPSQIKLDKINGEGSIKLTQGTTTISSKQGMLDLSGGAKGLSSRVNVEYSTSNQTHTQAFLPGISAAYADGKYVGGIINQNPVNTSSLVYSRIASQKIINSDSNIKTKNYYANPIKDIPLTGGNLYVVGGSVQDLASQYKNGINSLNGASKFQTNVYQLPANSIKTNTESDPITEQGVGLTKKEAYYNALDAISSSHYTKINTKSMNYGSQSTTQNSQSINKRFTSSTFALSHTYIKSYKIVSYRKDKYGEYWVKVQAIIGKLAN